jgi:hypothetical protein
VKAADNARVDKRAREMAAIAHADLNYDLQISDFIERKTQMDWYVTVFGTAVAREYVRSYTNRESRRVVSEAPYGLYQELKEEESLTKVEHTCTQVIHPLNFAHEIDKRNFKTSSWGSVRFALHISQVYAMLDHPDYYQPGVRKIIEQYEAGKLGRISVSNTSFYSENLDEIDTGEYIIVDEYHGPMKVKGKERDFGKKLCLFSQAHNVFLTIRPTPFRRHPYWKVQCYPDPDGPYGVGPNDMTRPINKWENSTVNQYNDYMNSALKFMYKVNPAAINGGVDALINGLPFGLLMLEKGQENLGNMIDTINRTGTIPPVGDILGLIAKLKQEIGPSSNLRGKSNEQLNDTATGISLMAQREDAMTSAIQEGIDFGIQDGMSLKMSNFTRFSEKRNAIVGDKGQEEVVEHYPYELEGQDFSYSIERKLADVEAGKNVSFLRLITGMGKLLEARGTPLPVEFLVDVHERVGRALSVDGVDEMFQNLRTQIKGMAPAVGGAPGGGVQMPMGSDIAPAPGGAPGGAPDAGMGTNQMAMALAG